MKLIFLFFYSALCKFIYKKKGKVPQVGEFNVPQTPELSKFIYPAVQKYIIDNTKYNEMISGEDIAQIETGGGVVLPMNIALNVKTKIGMLKAAKQIKNK